MHSLEIDYLVIQQQHKDRLRNIEHEQLLQVAKLQPGINTKLYRKTTSWLGRQMVKWGSKLQEYDPTPPSETYILKT